MKIPIQIVTAFFAVLISGCTALGPTRLIADTIGATGGAVVGSKLGRGSIVSTAAGAGSGVLLSELTQAGINRNRQQSFSSGYDKGRSDAAKQAYQLLQEQQKQAAQSNSVTTYSVTLPERIEQGALLKPGTVTLRIQE